MSQNFSSSLLAAEVDNTLYTKPVPDPPTFASCDDTKVRIQSRARIKQPTTADLKPFFFFFFRHAVPGSEQSLTLRGCQSSRSYGADLAQDALPCLGAALLGGRPNTILRTGCRSQYSFVVRRKDWTRPVVWIGPWFDIDVRGADHDHIIEMLLSTHMADRKGRKHYINQIHETCSEHL